MKMSFPFIPRKSKYTGKGESIGNQVELCQEYVRAHYGEAAAENIAVLKMRVFPAEI